MSGRSTGARSWLHLVELLDEDRAALGELLDDVLVVHDLLADVDRGAMGIKGTFNGLHGTIDASAITTRRG